MKWLKSKWIKWLGEAALILVVVVAVGLWQTRGLPDGPAPLFGGTLLDGRPFALEEMRGRPLLLHFWGTWCPVCRLELGNIAAIAEDHQVVTIAMNSGDAEELRAYMEEHQLHFPVIPDEQGTLAARYRVRGVPASFIVDPGGVIRFVEVGYTSELGLRARLWWAGR